MPPTSRKGRPTQVDIARRAGVSQATVSLVISGGAVSDQVAESTRQAVLAAASELGYTANVAARRLRGKRNHLLGIYTFEPVFPVDQRDFYYPFLVGVEEATAALGYDLLLFSSITSAADRSIYAGGVNRLRIADGCVLLGRNVRRDELAALVREDFPFVFLGRRELPDAQISYVAADYVAATSAMVTTLAGHGHERILYLRATEDTEPTLDREAGYRQGLAAAGLAVDESLIQALADPAELTAEHLQHWIARYGATAVLVEPTEDTRLTSALDEIAAAARIRFPQDCSIALLGDPPSWTNGPSRSAPAVDGAGPDGTQPGRRDWTRFSLPRVEMGREAARMLIELLEGRQEAPQRRSLPCSLVPGDSIGPAPHA